MTTKKKTVFGHTIDYESGEISKKELLQSKGDFIKAAIDAALAKIKADPEGFLCLESQEQRVTTAEISATLDIYEDDRCLLDKEPNK